MKNIRSLFYSLMVLIILALSSFIDPDTIEIGGKGNPDSLLYADIVGVATSASGNNYTFAVTIDSPDTGCDQYADWWEVISEDGDLIYRRILGHSHVGGPFTRSGGPVIVSENQKVWIRAHMNTTGFGANEGITYFGTVACGFKALEMAPGFALDIEDDEPQPGDCPF